MGSEPDSLESRARARVGRVLCDRWRLERLLGVGGVAAVYAAVHRNGNRVALKVLHPELAVDASIRRRFLREGYVANSVEHPGAIAVLDDAVDADGSVVAVMELLRGETLEARCQRLGGKLDPAEALRIAHALLDVLASAHARGILHRDVTPSNVFLTTKGEVKLLDFGIARLREPGSEQRTMSNPGSLGTPAFMPPEQARGLWDELDERTDLWAVGAVLFRAVSGGRVHVGRTPAEVLLAAMTRPAPSLGDVLSDAPTELAELVARSVAFDPNARFADATAFRAAIALTHRALTGEVIENSPALEVPEPDSGVADSTSSHSQPDAFGTTVAERAAPVRAWRTLVIGLTGAALVAAVSLIRHSIQVPGLAEAPEPLRENAARPAPEPARIPVPAVRQPAPAAHAVRSSIDAGSLLPSSKARRPAASAPKQPGDDWVLDLRK
jgi:eukaryotic-like serine/threonine-protein kinase